MAFLDTVKEIISSLKEVNLPDIKFSFITITKNDNSTTNYQDSSKRLKLNLNDLPSEQKKKLLASFPSALDEDCLFIEKNSQSVIEDFKSKEKDSGNQDKLDFIKKRIPVSDLNIWRAALYMRNYFCAEDKDRTSNLKQQIMQKHGDKGKNIANLCTANYLENFLMPLYDSLLEEHKDKSIVAEEFKKKYKRIVNELPFSIFVNSQMTEKEIKEQIVIKKKYGIKFLNIHGIGMVNIKKIRGLVLCMESEKEFLVKKLDVDGGVIFVRLNFIEE